MKVRQYPATVVRVTDSDTLEIDIDMGFCIRYKDNFN